MINNDIVTDNPYVMIPNVVVQNIISGETNETSYIQLLGKRTVAYLKQIIELQNVNRHIHFSAEMVLWMLDIQNNIARERRYLREFLAQLEGNSLITIQNEVDLESLRANDFIMAKLNIFDYNKEGKTQNYFMLLDSEYNKIMNEYLGSLDRYNLLNLFCNLKSRMWRNAVDVSLVHRRPEVAYPSYDTIMSDIFIESDKTLKQYINALVELDLIRYECAGDMAFGLQGRSSTRRMANFTYTLFSPNWEFELKSSISAFKRKKIEEGWVFLTKEQEVSADEKRSITQKINMFEKKSKESTLTQQDKKDLGKLRKQQEKWKRDYCTEADIRKLEEDKLKSENFGGEQSEIYDGMGYDRKAERAAEEEEEIREDHNLVEAHFGNHTGSKGDSRSQNETVVVEDSLQKKVSEVVVPENVAVHIPPKSPIGNANPFNPFLVEQKVNQEVSKAENAKRMQDLEERKREWELENNKNVKIIIRKVQAEKQDLVSKAKTEGDNLKPFVKATSSEGSPVSKSKLFEGLEDKNPGVFNSNIPKKFYEKAVDVFIREDLKTKEKKYMNNQLDENGFYDLEKLIEEEDKAG